jgi:hypothetical protein
MSSMVTVKVALQVLLAAMLLLGVVELIEYNSNARQKAASLSLSSSDPGSKPAASTTKQVHGPTDRQVQELHTLYGHLAKVSTSKVGQPALLVFRSMASLNHAARVPAYPL